MRAGPRQDPLPPEQVQLETARRARRRKVFFWGLLIDILIAASVIYSNEDTGESAGCC